MLLIQAITELCSIFGEIFDLIFLSKFSDCLITSTQQFGFKRKHSTYMCTIVLKETLAYTVDGGSGFCTLVTLLDATKAFDRVNYCKLFTKLMSRNIPPKYLPLLLTMYTTSVARVSWNVFYGGEWSKTGWSCQPCFVLSLH